MEESNIMQDCGLKYKSNFRNATYFKAFIRNEVLIFNRGIIVCKLLIRS